MPNVSVYDMQGKAVGEIALSDDIFAIEINTVAMHEAVKNHLANKRQGTQSTLTRSEVSGGGRKPWRQKGTGRARQGSTRSPQWTRGGVALGPKPRSYRYTLNKKLKRIALKSALSAKAAAGDIIVVENLSVAEIKTKTIANMLKSLKVERKALIVTAGADKNVYASAKNIPGVMTAMAAAINVYDILKHDKFIVAKEAVQKIEEVYA